MTKILDNLSNQELKELIYNKKVKINELSASALNDLLNYETDMLCFGKGNVEFICEISDALDKLERDIMLSKDEICQIIQKTKAENIEIIDKRAEKSVLRRKITLKKIAIIAAAVILITACSAVVATAFGFDLFKLLGVAADLPVGESMTVNGITFINHGEPKEYSSIEEMIEKENLDILYPAKLPEGIMIDVVSVNDVTDNGNFIQISTNDKNTSIQIDVMYSEAIIDRGKHEIYKCQDKTFYIFENEKCYFAYAYIDNNQYCIQANTHEDLILIIDNLKEK